MRKPRDITGNKYGKLTTIKYNKSSIKGETGWICKCDCGNMKTVTASRLFNKYTQSCGCMRNLLSFKSGDRINNIILIESKKNINNLIVWKYKCLCGKESTGFQSNLAKGVIKSCTCIHKKSRKRINDRSYKEITGRFWSRNQNNAKTRGLDFNINKSDVWDLFIKQDKKCALSNIEIGFIEKTISIDRIDSLKDYELSNIQLVHKTVNLMKMQLDQQDFIKWCSLIANFKLETES